MKTRSPLAAAWLFSLAAPLALLAACDTDRAADGARGACAEGGSLGDCREVVETPEEACDRLVRCAAIPRDAEDDNGFDWGRCVDRIAGLSVEQARFVIACVGASSCDELKVNGSPSQPGPRPFCLEFGDR
ncbi:MAG: hypothetical protein R3B48_06370 [Kofleriaceae bacterium]